MKWFNFLSSDIKVGDKVTCGDNYYGSDIICQVDRIYYRNREGHIYKFCRLSFGGDVVKTINVLLKKCKKINQ